LAHLSKEPIFYPAQITKPSKSLSAQPQKMADRLTQLQDCLDQFLVQMFATIQYIDTHHSHQHIDGQVDQFTPITDSLISQQSESATTATAATAAAGMTQTISQLSPQQQQQQAVEPASSSNPIPDAPALFSQRLSELAQDLVLKEQQVEALIAALPGIGSSQEAQEARLKELDEELKAVEAERDRWRKERELLSQSLDGWISGGVRRV
jgi:mediator of RNA polymerase II transcription subunit 21